MKHVNIDTNVFDEPEFTEASLEQIGVWLRLYVYCAKRENGGLITTAGSWSDSQCQRVLGCPRAFLDTSPLWHINVSGLLNLQHYNLIAEEFAKSRRKTHRSAVSAKSEVKSLAVRENGKLGGRPCKIITLPNL